MEAQSNSVAVPKHVVVLIGNSIYAAEKQKRIIKV